MVADDRPTVFSQSYRSFGKKMDRVSRRCASIGSGVNQVHNKDWI